MQVSAVELLEKKPKIQQNFYHKLEKHFPELKQKLQKAYSIIFYWLKIKLKKSLFKILLHCNENFDAETSKSFYLNAELFKSYFMTSSL